MSITFSSLEYHGEAQELVRRIQGAPVPDARLFADILANACPRALALMEMRKATRLKQLLASGAWTDAALALLELDLPQWKVRRIVCDDGEWHCRLSAQPWLPDGLDEVVESFHTELPLAILAAVVQVRQQAAPASRTGGPAGDARRHWIVEGAR
jgi:hypothetical protein